MKQHRILVVDDDPFVVKFLSTLIECASDMVVVAAAYDGQQAIEKINSFNVDIVLADIHMPKMDGVTLLSKLQEQENPPVFVAITALANEKSALKIIEMGGAGYVLKSQPPETIISSIRDALNGGIVVAPHAMKWIARRLASTSTNDRLVESIVSEATKRKRLSNSESEVLVLLCQGLGNQEIAKRLFYSESMIKKHISQLMKVFNTHSRLELVVSVMNQRWN